jgi:hypothetical protein
MRKTGFSTLVRRCAPLLLLLAACGGGGGAALLAPTGPVDLGTVSRTVPTVTTRSFANPFGTQASVALASADGGFGVQGGVLPGVVGPAGAIQVPVVFTPSGPGLATGTVTLRFTSGTSTRDQSETYQVLVESLTLTSSPADLAFGDVAQGTSKQVTTRISNPSSLSPVTYGTVQIGPSELTLLSPTLPVTIVPGGFADLTWRLTSAAGGPVTGLARLGVGAVGGPLDLPVSANLAPQEVVVDLGTVTLGANQTTGVLQFTMPSDGAAFMIEAVGGQNDGYGLASLTGPGGKVYENTDSTGSYIWSSNQEVFTAQVPNTDRPDVQLVSGGGVYTFQIRRYWGLSSTLRVRVLIERRPGGTIPTSRLDLNVWLTQGLPVDAATAEADTRLQTVLGGVGTILAAQGVTLGDVDYYDVADPLFDQVSEGEFPSLLRITSAATETRLNLFFVEEAIGGNVVGVAGMIGGPKANGTGASGVMSVYEGFSTSIISLVAAHEIGHYLGLWHTVEAAGSHDFIDDTLECPANGAGGPCTVGGGGYLMHWQAVGGTTISAGQGTVIRGHPSMAPPATTSTKRLAAPAQLSFDTGELLSLPSDWCATCARCRAQARK